ncbi:hypothetical protein [Salinibacterium sp. SWN1162]|uniref:hypothetical protein n=1 Tax=Salinibacterium sp. SWN1162 TaxID=2792053 RepID=UPI0018CE09C1|nr:hypothetical protein [Salinibacterium sp. SWN1162]MBH0008876.1 hypothetical protein [Salinibacterium sp. SWN1162]
MRSLRQKAEGRRVLALRVKRVLGARELLVELLDRLHHALERVAHVAETIGRVLEPGCELVVAVAELARGVLRLEVVAEKRGDGVRVRRSRA